jgi:hypothetical protein
MADVTNFGGCVTQVTINYKDERHEQDETNNV